MVVSRGAILALAARHACYPAELTVPAMARGES